MDNKINNHNAFTSKLTRYKNKLIEMSELTDKEIERVSLLGREDQPKGDSLVKETAIFMHYQVAVFLKELGELVHELPDYPLSEGMYLTKEIKDLENLALTKLKELAGSDNNEYLKQFDI